MPRLKVDDFDIDELEAAEYNEDFERYTGKQPPKGTILAGYIKKAWWTYSQADNPMIVLLFVADGNDGPEAKYNGLPIWERLVFIPSVKFRWKPWIDLVGVTLRDIKGKITIEADEDNMGAPIIKIASWKPGEDAAYRVITKTETDNNGDRSTKVDVWLPLEDEEEEDEEDDEEEVEEDEEEDDLEEEEDADDEEEDEEPAPPPTTRKTRTVAAKPPAKPTATATPAKRAASATAKPATRTAKPAPAARPGTARRTTAASKKRGYDEEPPF